MKYQHVGSKAIRDDDDERDLPLIEETGVSARIVGELADVQLSSGI